jgi:SAM-dependent methyltransferase
VYSKHFYKGQSIGSFSSAEAIVPYVLEILNIKSVVDMGCGVGSWLSVFLKNGVKDVLGFDGSWVDTDMLQIPNDCFRACDLKQLGPVERTFDLAMSVEVAEHLPESCAEDFVDKLTSFSKMVLFAAAIPCQRGRHHVNCQWPEYWADLFRKRGYLPVDVIRRHFWQNENIEYWYRQNILLYIEQEALKQLPTFIQMGSGANRMLSTVHPACFLRYADPARMSFMRTVGFLPKIAYYSGFRILKQIVSKSQGSQDVSSTKRGF